MYTGSASSYLGGVSSFRRHGPRAHEQLKQGLERINSTSETKGSFYSFTHLIHVNGWVPAVYELRESKLLFVSLIEFIRSGFRF